MDSIHYSLNCIILIIWYWPLVFMSIWFDSLLLDSYHSYIDSQIVESYQVYSLVFYFSFLNHIIVTGFDSNIALNRINLHSSKSVQKSHDVGNIFSSIPKSDNDAHIFCLSNTIYNVLEGFYTWIKKLVFKFQSK